ncbi:MAG: PilZ domain-containing protein [Pyrinomonadaceae bacterium]
MARRQERISHFVEVTLESSSGKQQARMSDLSLGGCFIDSIADVPKGEKIAFEIVRPGEAPLRFSGTVVYTLPGMGFGVEFTELNDEQKTYLEAKALPIHVT